MQKGGSGLGSALYNAAFAGAGPPLGRSWASSRSDPGMAACEKRAGGTAAEKGCDASFFCSMQSGASDSVKGGLNMGALCKNGAALLGQ